MLTCKWRERGYFDVVCPGYHLTFYLPGATLVSTVFCHSLSGTLLQHFHFEWATHIKVHDKVDHSIGIYNWLFQNCRIFRLIFTRTKDIHYRCPSLYFLESEERLKWNVSNIFWTYYVSPGKIFRLHAIQIYYLHFYNVRRNKKVHIRGN